MWGGEPECFPIILWDFRIHFHQTKRLVEKLPADIVGGPHSSSNQLEPSTD